MSAYEQALKSVGANVSEMSKFTHDLTMQQTINALSTKALTKEKMVEILKNKGVVASEAEAIATKIASAQANGVATFSLKAYGAALLDSIKTTILWLTTNPVGIFVAIAAAVGGAIAAYKYFDQTIEEQKEKISELETEYENAAQEVNTLSEEIKTNAEQMSVLREKLALGTITLVEKDELNRLATANKLLQEQVTLKKKEEEKKAKELSTQNQATFNEEFGDMDTETQNQAYSLYGARILDGENLSDKDLILSIKAIYTGISDAIAIGDEETAKNLTDGKDHLVSILYERSDNILKGFTDYQDTMMKYMNPDGTFDDAASQQLWDEIEGWKRETYQQSGRSGEWNALQLGVVLDDESLSVTKADINKKLSTGTLTEGDIEKYDDLMISLDESNLILEEGETVASVYLRYLNEIATSQNNVSSSTPDFTIARHGEDIDKFQSDLQSLSGALQKVKSDNLTDSDLLDLMQDFPILSTETDNLGRAITDLVDNELDKLKTKLEAAGASDEILSLFDSIAEESKYLSLDQVLSGLETTKATLKSVKDETNTYGTISASTLQSISSQYNGLNGVVDDYLAKKVDEQDVIDALEEQYKKDLNNYGLYMANKQKDDEQFYTDIKKSLSDDLIEKANQYGIDLKNYSTFAEAKLAIDAKYIEARNELENASSVHDNTIEGVQQGLPTLMAFKSLDRKNIAEQEVLDVEQLIADFESEVGAIVGGFDKNVTTNDFLQEIDWIASSVEHAQKKVDDLNNSLGSTKGFTPKLGILEQLVEANDDLIEATGNAADEYEKIWEKKSSKISNEHRDLITGGKTKLEIEKFTDESTYDAVMEAKDYYDLWQTSEEQLKQLLVDQSELQDEINSILLERAELSLEILSTEDTSNMTAAEKNRLLEREKALKKEILEYNLALAETDEEKDLLKKKYKVDISDNEEQQYQNERDERASKASYYGSRVQDIQNEIDLAEASGGSATEQQYTDMNLELENERRYYKADYDAALEKRNGAEWGSAKWNQYNEEVQEAQDNINRCTIAQIENNRAIILLEAKPYEDMNEELQNTLDLLNKYQSKVENAIGYASTLVQNQIDLLNKEKESVSNYWDNEIKIIQTKKDALTESNDELQRSIDLQNAKYNLEKAMNNKTTRVYRAGQGFVYEADQDAIRDAQQELDNLEYDNQVANFDKTIDALNAQKENELLSIDDRIKSWQEYLEKINATTSSYEDYTGMQDLIQVFGADAISSIMNKDMGIVGDFESTLNTTKADVDDTQQKIDSNNFLIKTIQKEAAAYTGSAASIIEAKNNIKLAITDNAEEIAAIETRTGKTKEMSSTWSTSKEEITLALTNLEEAEILAKENEFTTLSQRIQNLKDFQTQATTIYNKIATLLSNAKSAMDSLNAIDSQTNSSGSKPNTTSNTGKGKLPTYHSGGIVDGQKKLPEKLIALTDANLKPNEVIAKLLRNEVVLNQQQIGNLFDNISGSYASLAPSKSNSNNISVTIGDVHVHNPDNSDMIVNEIVKELPLKVVQKLNSK